MKNSLSQFSVKRMLAITALAFAVPMSAMAFQGGKGGERCEGRDGMRPTGMKMQGGMHGQHGMGLPGLHRLNLSEPQQDKIFDIMHAQAPVARDQMKALRQAEQELQTLRTASDYSDAKARALVDSIAKQRADMEMARLQTERKVLEVLTPEQRKQLSEMKPQRGEGRGPRDGRGPAGDRTPGEGRAPKA